MIFLPFALRARRLRRRRAPFRADIALPRGNAGNGGNSGGFLRISTVATAEKLVATVATLSVVATCRQQHPGVGRDTPGAARTGGIIDSRAENPQLE